MPGRRGPGGPGGIGGPGGPGGVRWTAVDQVAQDDATELACSGWRSWPAPRPR